MENFERQLLTHLLKYLDEDTFHQIYGKEDSFEEFRKRLSEELGIEEQNSIDMNSLSEYSKEQISEKNEYSKEQISKKSECPKERFETIIPIQKEKSFLKPLDRYKMMRIMGLKLKDYQDQYGKFSFSSDHLTIEERFQELLGYYRMILDDKKDKSK